MNPILLFFGFCILAAIWTGIWAWVLLSTRHPIDYEQVDGSAADLRKRLSYVASALVVVITLASIYWLPYAFIRNKVFGAPSAK